MLLSITILNFSFILSLVHEQSLHVSHEGQRVYSGGKDVA